MNYIETELNDLIIIGISVRTSNQDGKAMADIGNLFNQFFSQNIMEKIENKLSSDLYCVYTDYESDYMGDYTVFLGCSVASLNNQLDFLDAKHIPKSQYRKYTSKGNIHAAVGKTWSGIWSDNSIPRKYVADFDIYGKDSQDPENAIVYTYLSVNN